MAQEQDRFLLAQNRRFIGLEDEKDFKEPFFFLQLADPQFGFFHDSRHWEDDIALSEEAVRHINRLRPRFAVVCGDWTHAFPGEPEYLPQMQDIKRVFSKIDQSIPLVCVCGNHDVGNRPTAHSIDSYRQHFGDDYFAFWVGGCRCIVLNSQLYSNATGAPQLQQQQVDWLRQELASLQGPDRPAHIFVFQHIPWFLQQADEENDYFNIEKQLRLQVLEELHQAGVTGIFCGHYHRNAGGLYKNMPQVVTSAIGGQLGNDKSGLRVVSVYRDSIAHQYYSFEEAPQQVNL
eukprot:TRINITY_DN10669_c0_g1_i2.p1 TRINITY_DN10669_c0_g1~~TRINITY_DN10669_c0_g1_i2.p1  ORF type:complete len:290 (-),score=63.37 TRINITY_DN10669_c0_g1_i2:204-1073(-)